MLRLADKTFDLEKTSTSEIRKEYETLKTINLNKIKDKLRKIELDTKDFYADVYEIDIYYAKEKLYMASAIEYENEVYLEFLQLDNLDELRIVIDEGIVQDPDGVIFNIAVEIISK